ncbi:MAG: radical SAM protein [Desulfurococcales archaeon]|nr:radical SAM protein [Desulfurococcales archaeon]MCE4605045.1 radical SAM protein [Desulfurococcales archaeon]
MEALQALVDTGYESMWMHVRPDAVRALYNPVLRERLRWYYAVLRGIAPPKFKLVRSVESPLQGDELQEASLEDLMRAHKDAASMFRDEWGPALEEPEKATRLARTFPRWSLLHLKAELAKRLTSPCILCDRKCRVDRASGRLGACRLAWDVYVHTAFLHLGEESPLVPSGTIFYGGCNFTCVFCQNYDVSQTEARRGFKATPRSLAALQDLLAARGARNINHVGGDPTPSMHVIVESLLYVRSDIPQLWNSNMYMSPEAMEVLVDLIDIWLPDFKWGDNRCARRLSIVPSYVETVTRNLETAARHGDMIIRHLVMPDHIECCTRRVLEWIASHLPLDRVVVNVMGQYTPQHLVERNPRKWRDIARRVSREEVEEAKWYASSLGLYLLD